MPLPRPSHLDRLEGESLHILREVAASFRNPVMLYSVGKDSSVLLHLLLKAFHPRGRRSAAARRHHVEVREMIEFRDRRAAETGVELRVHTNPDGLAQGIGPVSHGPTVHTDVMKTQALKQALDEYRFDAAIGGARRDEEKSRAKERVFSFRSRQHAWDPKNQRPELWNLYNARIRPGESVRVFPLSNWTELDVWLYIYRERIPDAVAVLRGRSTRRRARRRADLVDDERFPLLEGERPQLRRVRFRTLGCYPLTGAIESEADTLEKIIAEMLVATTSERQAG